MGKCTAIEVAGVSRGYFESGRHVGYLRASPPRRPVRDPDLKPAQTTDPELLKRALHAVNNLVVITEAGAGHRAVWVNDFFCVFTRYDREEVLGQDPLALLIRGDAEQVPLRALDTALREHRYVRVLIRCFRKDGAAFWNDLHVSPIGGSGGTVDHFVLLMNDVTDLQEALLTVTERESEDDETAEHERERFGMELHDGLGQTLVGTRMLAEVLAERLRSVDSAEAVKADRIGALVADALSEAKAMARAMNPIDAAPEGLASALHALAASLNATWAETERRIAVEAVAVDFPDRRQALHLYRIAQEAVSNAVRHSESAAIRVRLAQRDRDVVLEVVDEGPARSRRAHDDAGAEHEGMGHHGMPYRAALIGAEFHRGPAGGGGTVVRVTLPLDARRKPENVRTAEH